MIVLDASVAIDGLLTNGAARRVLAERAVAAPHLIDAEVIHVLRRRVGAGTIALEDAQRALRRWQHLAIRRIPVAGLLDRIWALRDNLSAYDATYVAVAEVLDTELLTADARLAGAPGPRCPITVVRR